MNSLQKQQESGSAGPTETFMVTFEKNILAMNDVLEVELLMKKLQFLGVNYDPFQGVNSTECQNVIDQLGLEPHLQNPYLATNILLRLLDKTEERLNNLKQ